MSSTAMMTKPVSTSRPALVNAARHENFLHYSVAVYPLFDIGLIGGQTVGIYDVCITNPGSTMSRGSDATCIVITSLPYTMDVLR